MERAGPKVKDILSEKHPWANDVCSLDNCLPCRTKLGTCRGASICYRIKCQTCLSQGIKAHYIGESNRTWYDRAREHSDALRTQNKKYAIVKH